MAALTADEVGQVVTFIAPGFVARLAYVARFPHREPPEFSMLVASVVISLPLVALSMSVAPVLGIHSAKVTDLGYVALLLGLSWVVGYISGALRAWPLARDFLVRIGLVYQPESSIYAQTLLDLPPGATITIEFSDGRKLNGTPRAGPGLGDGGIDELYVTHPAWWDSTETRWVDSGVGGGVIVPLKNVHSITLDRDPT